MDKLPEVEAAKTLMTEAVTWSVMRWLREKRRVRRSADQANAALDVLSESVRNKWTDTIRRAYEALGQDDGAGKRGSGKKPPPAEAPDAARIATKIRNAEVEAEHARMDAEETFDRAESQLSTTLAREGCRKSIHAWGLREKAIRAAEAAMRAAK